MNVTNLRTEPACFPRACVQVANACRNHALQVVCNKTGVKNISDVFEISASSCNRITEKSVKKLLGGQGWSLPGRAQRQRVPSQSCEHPPHTVLWGGVINQPPDPKQTLVLGDFRKSVVVPGWAGPQGGGSGCRINPPLGTSPVVSGLWELPLCVPALARGKEKMEQQKEW